MRTEVSSRTALTTASRQRCLRVVDVDLAIETTSHAAMEALDELLAGFAPSLDPSPSRRFELWAEPGDGAPAVLRFDGEPLGEAATAAALVPTLLYRLDRLVRDEADRLLLHAGVVERSGTAVVLPGAPDAGKSTLTAGLVQAGFGYLSDEVAAVAWEGPCTVEPYPKPVSLDAGARALMADLDPAREPTFGEDGFSKAHIPLDRIRPGAFAPSCPVGVVVFPRYEKGAPTSIERVRRSRALLDLASNTFGFDVRSRRSLTRLAELVGEVDCYRLVAGSLEQAVETVGGLAECRS